MRTPILATLALLTAAAPAAAAERLVGASADGRFVTFHSDSPGALRASVALSGLAANERIVGLDVRPAIFAIHGLTSAGRQVTIDPRSGATTPVGGPLNPALSGTSFGFDFNPTVDRLRLTSNGEQNLRLHPETGAVAAVDKPLAYGPMDPGAGVNPEIIGSAYTNSVAGATTTTLLNIDAARDALVTQAPPNDGVLNTVGSLGVDVDGVGGFDIAASGQALAALTPRGAVRTRLYAIDLAKGTARPATAASEVPGVRLEALAATGVVPDDRTAPGVRLRTKRTGSRVRVTVRCNEACTFVVRGRRGRVVATAGSAAVTVRAARRSRISVQVTDAAGNKRTARRKV